jgi:hypothetical protein
MKAENIIIGKRAKKANVDYVEKRSQEDINSIEDQEWNFERITKDDEINRLNKKIIDLNLHESEDKTGNKQ